VKLLLDTHALLWWWLDEPQLSPPPARRLPTRPTKSGSVPPVPGRSPSSSAEANSTECRKRATASWNWWRRTGSGSCRAITNTKSART